MKRWVLKAGSQTLDRLIEETVKIPQPGPGEIRVRVSAVSLNYREQLILTSEIGAWRTDADLVPVADAAGIVDALGDGVSKWAVGDRVITVYLRDFLSWPPHENIGMGLGSGEEDGVLAEYIVLPAARFTRAPESLTLAEASTLPCAAVTAWTSLQQAHPVKAGDKVLTLGTGGVSLFAISFAAALGAEVFVTTSQADKRPKLLSLGVKDTFDYRNDPEWGRTVFAQAGGMDKVVNTAGFGSLNQSVEALAYGGDIAVVGLMTFGEAIDPGSYLAKGVSLRGIPVGSRVQQEEVVAFVDAHAIKPLIHKTFAFSDARAAYAEQLSPDLFGKIVISVSGE